ncbi:MAG: hypothetical protein OXK77_04490 [Gemmatimonadota bacterium]|nr:hypothetical protein [Gemmatimonadota bacterium]MDE2864656.1 hypothetical protein [Gemmatimonadota bacterium]
MNEWLREWWPILAALVLLVVALGWFVQRMVKSSSASGGANAFETVFRKEMVQPIITHIMAWTFAVLAASMIITFLATGQFDRAEDVFAYIVAVIGPIVGFWFGSRAGEGKDKDRDSGNNGRPK